MIDIILKLAFIDDIVEFFAQSLSSSIWTNLTHDELIVLAGSKSQCLINRSIGVGNDILKG